MARQKTSPIEDMITLASKMPWQVNIILAILSYIILHRMTNRPPPQITGPNQLNVAINAGLKNVFATFGQIVFPAIFGVAAVLSGINKKRTNTQSFQFKNYQQKARPERPRQERKEPVFSNIPTPQPPTPPQNPTNNTPATADETPIIEAEFEELTPTKTNDKNIPDKLTTELLREIEWKRFEILCCEMLKAAGYRATETDYGADGGIDIKVTKRYETNPFGIVQCKAWNSNVGVKEIRDLLGTKTKNNYEQAMLITKKGFTNDAIEFAKDTGITLVTGQMLIDKINGFPEDSLNRILEITLEDDYKTPTCPNCGIKLVRRNGTNGGKDFWGCKRYYSVPKCRFKMKIGSQEQNTKTGN